MAYTPSYTKKNFVNGQAPAINAGNLNSIENAIVSVETNAQTDSARVDTLVTNVGTLQTEMSSKASATDLNAEITARQTADATLSRDLANLSAKESETERSLNALWRINKGQTYDFEEVESNAYSDSVISGARVADVRVLGGKSVVADGELISAKVDEVVSKSQYASVDLGSLTWAKSTNYFYANIGRIYVAPASNNDLLNAKCDKYEIKSFNGINGALYDDCIGATQDGYLVIRDTSYSDASAFKASLNGTILWYAPTDTSTVVTLAEVSIPTTLQSISLKSAGSVYDYFDFEKILYKNMKSVDLGTLEWTRFENNGFYANLPTPTTYVSVSVNANMISTKYPVSAQTTYGNYDKTVCLFTTSSSTTSSTIIVRDKDYNDVATFKASLSGTILWYESSSSDGADKEFMFLHKRVGVVDLGSLDWGYISSVNGFWTQGIKTLVKSGTSNCLCAKYSVVSGSKWGQGDKTLFISADGNQNICITDSAYSSADSFKSAMNGVLLYYELATEQTTLITDDIDYFDCEASGTITFHQTSTELPIPHKTEYTVALSEVE